MREWHGPLNKVDGYRYEIPQSYKQGMRTNGMIFADEKMISQVKRDNAPEQVANVAHLPGILSNSMAMPDIHWGYGFPIGGVAGMDMDDGVISPGGVGYDINCGVRLVRTDLAIGDVEPKIQQIIDTIFENVPSGVGSKGKVRLEQKELDNALEMGAKWAVSQGYGWEKDLEHLEENGYMDAANSSKVSHKAKSRGAPQLGTLGAGNHFLEIQRVDEIFDKEVAAKYGMTDEGQIMIMIHCMNF